ncbi:MAG: hypothetical protein JO359_15625, partial [Candidatus Eremiobacteraeota bacterium]|nr:hypothetical protein [Candidatus Eremiobacteraeota bacterium]
MATAAAGGCASVAVSPNRLYVTYRSIGGANSALRIDESVSALRGTDIGAEENGLAHRAVTLPPGTDLASAAAALRRNPAVVDVANVHLRSRAASVNDPFADNVDQWSLYKMNVPAAWSLTT